MGTSIYEMVIKKEDVITFRELLTIDALDDVKVTLTGIDDDWFSYEVIMKDARFDRQMIILRDSIDNIRVEKIV